MNDPNKKIDVNLSSLMSLKAELLRKQAEVSKVKATRSTAPDIPSKAKTFKKDKIITELHTSTKSDSKVYEVENTALLEKSKQVLEAKSKYYDRMTAMGGQLNSDDNCLVLFNRKKQEDQYSFPAERRYSSSSDSFNSDKEHSVGPAHPDGEWVEYTDCLGRTRKCMRGDLELIKKKDTELACSIPERLDQTQPNWMIDMVDKKSSDEFHAPASVIGDGVSVMSKHDEMRNNWEKKEVENISKENVHYQDVFFDEARQHGVGYYAFSTDDEERARQQKELEGTRQKTLNEQANREAQRNHREKIIAERVKAAKNRHRARLGLQPLEEDVKEENTKEKPQKETKEERKNRKHEEKLKRRQQREEQIREEERKSYIRPWDKEKLGVRDVSERSQKLQVEESWAYRPDRNPMSQEEWNERKRTERNPDFAPSAEKPSQKDLKRRGNTYDYYESTMPLPNKVPRTSFKADDSVFPITPAQNPFASVDGGSFDSFAPFQSTRSFQRKNFSAFTSEADEGTSETRRGAEIPPPPDMDPGRYIRPQQTQQSLESSIEAGLKFLRNNFDKNTLSNKSSWTARSDY